MLQEIIPLIRGEHYLALMLTMVLGSILRSRSVRSEKVRRKSFWLTVAVCAMLVIQDVLERYAQGDPARRNLRMITSILGYSLRPAAVLGFLLVIWPTNWKVWYLWVPIILNAALYCTAPVLKELTFGFHEDSYAFYRGPLGRTMFVVCILYMGLILFMIHVRFRDRRTGEMITIYLCAAGCMGAMVMDVETDGVSILTAVLVSSMTFYLFLRSQDTDHEPLTQLWNRMVFYEDCGNLKAQINGVASIDMNGLKQMNDDLGHEAGDKALKTIGESLHRVMNRKVSAYRIGGDEFMLLFFNGKEEQMKQTVGKLLKSVEDAGLSVAAGLAYRTEAEESLEELIRISDQRMYEDKGKYYQTHDRRGRH